MLNKIFTGILIIAFIFIAWQEGLPGKVSKWISGAFNNSKISTLSNIDDGASFPGPLKSLVSNFADKSKLTNEGVILETNKQRTEQGVSILTYNAKLAQAAEYKANDILAKQYFEHNSPEGKKPSDIISATGYEYIVVGENLALGNFLNDSELVIAWMNSPGHRANILDKKYTQIGVAVKRGTYEGKTVWVAVQEFGAPLSDCPGANKELKNSIESNRQKMRSIQIQLDDQKSKLENNYYQTPSSYNQAIDNYNSLANQYNNLVADTKQLVETYNSQVNSFNSCLQK